MRACLGFGLLFGVFFGGALAGGLIGHALGAPDLARGLGCFAGPLCMITAVALFRGLVAVVSLGRVVLRRDLSEVERTAAEQGRRTTVTAVLSLVMGPALCGAAIGAIVGWSAARPAAGALSFAALGAGIGGALLVLTRTGLLDTLEGDDGA